MERGGMYPMTVGREEEEEEAPGPGRERSWARKGDI